MFKIQITVIGFFLICFSCKTKVFQSAHLNKIIKENNIEGCIAIYDYQNNKFSIENEFVFKKKINSFSPHCILIALQAIETGIIKDANQNIIITHAKAKNLKEAFEKRDLVFLKNIYEQLDKKRLWEMYQKIKYFLPTHHKGVLEMTTQKNSIDSLFYIPISVDIAMGFAIQLYLEKLPFQKRTYAIINECCLYQTSASEEGFYYTLEDDESFVKAPQRWFVGWKNYYKRPYFFAIYDTSTNGLNKQNYKYSDTIINSLFQYIHQ